MPKVTTCTAQLMGGKFCDAAGDEDMPFPLCFRHAGQVWVAMNSKIRSEVQSDNMAATAVSRERPSCVYYVLMGDRIKIGTSRSLAGRLTQLMARPRDVLAIEPGDATLERERHTQFAADRIDRGREFFRPSEALCSHIEQIARQDAPTWAVHLTNWQSVRSTRSKLPELRKT